MKAIIIYSSYHHGNTKKVALAMGEAINAEVIEEAQAKTIDFSKYDLIGFGSGIYAFGFNKKMVELIGNASLESKNVFVFSTNDSGSTKNHKAVLDILNSKNANILGSFSCKGWDTFGPFKLIGGVSKNHPDEADLKAARDFVKNICDNNM
ncbi:flavodoxin family protein [Clostridium sp. YIM B02505]|uniref:Flavodoxin family protein n=1 Tax=Clostridium yunnanense TaxID=2800325 RepID=A0ABS1EIA3_9CLOT|nr:flavodoxin family protein [Clostridium yunnanense]MBK1809104.1 flavodoxin family protein [Clostridium yunnanense]